MIMGASFKRLKGDKVWCRETSKEAVARDHGNGDHDDNCRGNENKVSDHLEIFAPGKWKLSLPLTEICKISRGAILWHVGRWKLEIGSRVKFQMLEILSVVSVNLTIKLWY